MIGPMPGTLISSRHSRFCFTSVRTALSNAVTCSRSLDHAASIGRTIGATSGRSATRSSLRERAAADRPRQHAEGLEHAADVVRQSGHHTNQLKASTQQCAGAVCIKRLYMHRAVPTCAHDLRQSFGIIAVGLVELHA